MVKSEWASPEKTIDLIESILKQQTQVIYLAQNQDKLIPQLYSISCQGIVEQQRVKEQLLIAIKAVESGGTYYSQGLFDNSQMILLGPLIELFKELDLTTQKLTPKERKIAEFYTTGLSLTDIMKELEISNLLLILTWNRLEANFRLTPIGKSLPSIRSGD
ncbi:MAG: response regulator transcription factor [Pleurocapsa sp. CRU_1_2]|nr:response regulator transcription factor [Pleurocapsa sp. CRU_1_2]